MNERRTGTKFALQLPIVAPLALACSVVTDAGEPVDVGDLALVASQLAVEARWFRVHQ